MGNPLFIYFLFNKTNPIEIKDIFCKEVWAWREPNANVATCFINTCLVSTRPCKTIYVLVYRVVRSSSILKGVLIENDKQDLGHFVRLVGLQYDYILYSKYFEFCHQNSAVKFKLAVCGTVLKPLTWNYSRLFYFQCPKLQPKWGVYLCYLIIFLSQTLPTWDFLNCAPRTIPWSSS